MSSLKCCDFTDAALSPHQLAVVTRLTKNKMQMFPELLLTHMDKLTQYSAAVYDHAR